MSTWAKCPELFLYTKRNDVYLWKCNKTTWMPLITADFDDLGKVTDYFDLIGGKDSILDWDKSSYIDLVAYISPRRLLVNSRGLVIAELHKFGQDGKMDENELPLYVRSLDVLSLKPFGLRDRTIPSRTVRYLEAEGRAALVEDSTTTTTTTTTTELDDEKRAGLVKQVAELIAANKTLKNDKEAVDKNVTVLKETNKTLKGENEAREKKATELKDRNKALSEDVTAQKTVATNAQQERDGAKRAKEAAEKQVAKLKEMNKTLKRDKEAAEKKTVGLQAQFDALPISEKKEVWMNSYIDERGNWEPFESLSPEIFRIIATQRGFYTAEYELTTNVHLSLMYVGRLADNNNVPIDVPRGTTGCYGYKAIKLDELNPCKEKARFVVKDWYRAMYNGDMYAIKERFPGAI